MTFVDFGQFCLLGPFQNNRFFFFFFFVLKLSSFSERKK